MTFCRGKLTAATFSSWLLTYPWLMRAWNHIRTVMIVTIVECLAFTKRVFLHDLGPKGTIKAKITKKVCTVGNWAPVLKRERAVVLMPSVRSCESVDCDQTYIIANPYPRIPRTRDSTAALVADSTWTWLPFEIIYALPYRCQLSLWPAQPVVSVAMVAALVAFPVLVALLQQRCAVKMLIVSPTPSWIGFFHLDHGVFDCAVECGCRVPIAGVDGEIPRGSINCVAREHKLISFLLVGDDVGMIGLSQGLAAEVSNAGFSLAG
ncbi:hypothetical protein E6O75_ATG03609 [Venturia nashicola]|uniref:Uncharacterized protein n=1 Tax=Venturia nashicola TaxID=86259 RepID=A0A4Z1PJE9_9PEZI|nr:hypothetical protein E6O75_ATG03609 [Venturia nashicola]